MPFRALCVQRRFYTVGFWCFPSPLPQAVICRRRPQHHPSCLQIINHNVVIEAPWSVGLLMDRNITTCTTTGISSQLHRIADMFIGNPYDRKHLSYAACMAGNSRLRLTVVRLVPDEIHRRGISRDRQLDEEVVGWFRVWAVENKRVVMREERVTVGEEILTGIWHLGMDYDLMMVGRSHGSNSALLEGLLTWSDNPEVGVISGFMRKKEKKVIGIYPFRQFVLI